MTSPPQTDTTAGSPFPLTPAESLTRNLKLLLAAFITGLGWPEPRLEVSVHDVCIPNLPAALQGFLIAQVTDLHAGPRSWGPYHAAAAAVAVRSAAPNVLINTGDFLQWEPPVEKARALFEKFLVPTTLDDGSPNIAILGNHDYYAGVDSVDALTRELESEGVCVLTNSATQLVFRGCPISIVCLCKHRPGFDDAVSLLESSSRPRIVLIHEPDLAGWIPGGAADLVLAGHTHGGQITFPFFESLIVKRFCGSNYVEGWYSVNGNPMYVNRGLGCTGIPLRFRARPEVALFRLLD